MSDTIQPVPDLREPPTDAPAPAPTSAPQDPLAPVPDTSAASKPPEHAAKGSDTAPPFDWRALVDAALDFLSTASNETLGACLFGLLGGTYLILGRVGLVLIGIAGGVVLHATWESHAQGDLHGPDQTREARRRELGVDVAHRLLSRRDRRGQDGKDDNDDDADLRVRLYSGQELDFSDFRPETAAALTELTDAVIRDYVKYARARKTNMLMYLSNAKAGGGTTLSFPPKRCSLIRAAKH